MASHFAPEDRVRSTVRTVAAWLDASPSELVGLVLLLSGSLAVTAVLWLRPGTPPPAEHEPMAAPTGGTTVTVHVSGAVVAPGLVELPEGGRVADAVELAGGVTPDAVPAGLNLARPVADGEQIVVPHDTPPDEGQDGSAPEGGDSAFRPDGRLDLNRASAADLEELPGIGPVLAQRIVDWRDEHGPFTDPGQLREVPGIGERTFQTLVELVTV